MKDCSRMQCEKRKFLIALDRHRARSFLIGQSWWGMGPGNAEEVV